MKIEAAKSRAELIERWRQCERVLVNLSPHEREKHWDMGRWGLKTLCGTIACAAGHCAMDPWFQERGFKFRDIGAMDFTIPYVLDIGDENFESASASAVSTFFGSIGSRRVFFRPDHRSVEDVIEEVRRHTEFLKICPFFVLDDADSSPMWAPIADASPEPTNAAQS